MKRSGIIILSILAIVLVFSLCSCKDIAGGDETQAVYYTVKFDDGTNVTEFTVLENTTVAAPAEPIRDGFIFDKWTCDGKTWKPDAKVNSNMTVIANWIDAKNVYERRADGDGGVFITGVKDEYATMKIPSFIDGVKVVGIDDEVFRDVTSETVRTIIVPETVTYIGNNAFNGCSDIEIEVNGGLTFIGECAFNECNMLTKVGFGEGLVTIPPEAFSGCSSLRELRFPASLSLIDENAFEDCTGLVSIVLHGSLATVGDGAFYNCTSLKTLYLYGDEHSLDNMQIAEMNDTFTAAKVYYHASEKPQTEGSFWYFDDKGKIKLW